MDVALLLILPVIGGYYFTNNWNVTHFRSAREEGHRLYFRAVLYGSVLFTVVYLLRVVLNKFVTPYAGFEALLDELILPLLKPDKDGFKLSSIAITSFYSLIIGVTLWKPLNYLFPRDHFLKKAVQNNDFERLIHTAVEKNSPLCMTVENQKVYVGFVVKTLDPTQDRKTLGILPVMSGYRLANRRVEFTTYYSDIYDEIRNAETGRFAHLTPDDFEIVIPVDKIVSANMFDILAYEEFGRKGQARKKAKQS
ncbi:MAG TPA: hypothetical protein VJS66_05915 [Burkholderiales bacterium]|nr:hypothetical protein [Burkholderiales bacterium]